MPNALAHLLVLEALGLNANDTTTRQAVTIDKFPDTAPLPRWAQRTFLGWKTKVERMHQPLYTSRAVLISKLSVQQTVARKLFTVNFFTKTIKNFTFLRFMTKTFGCFIVYEQPHRDSIFYFLLYRSFSLSRNKKNKLETVQ